MDPPRALDASVVRYAPGLVLPPYRHVPGITPHPRSDPLGHSYGHQQPAAGPLTPDNWRSHQAYLYGVDLYNQAFWWEAHEWWEATWRTEAPGAVTGLFLPGLIQIAAALIKWHQGNRRGTERLHERGRRRLLEVESRAGPRYLGLEVGPFLPRLALFLARHPRADAAAYEDPQHAPVLRLVGR
ncbi:MAG: DUF309 domain-containing protein [Candidatus Latescibacterota bacterium]